MKSFLLKPVRVASIWQVIEGGFTIGFRSAELFEAVFIRTTNNSTKNSNSDKHHEEGETRDRQEETFVRWKSGENEPNDYNIGGQCRQNEVDASNFISFDDFIDYNYELKTKIVIVDNCACINSLYTNIS